MKIYKVIFLLFALIFCNHNSFANQNRVAIQNKISHNKANQNKNLVIFAEQSMTVALTKIARLYSQTHNIGISINFISPLDLIEEFNEDNIKTSPLLNKIESGELVHVLISGNDILIDNLKKRGLIEFYSKNHIVSDKLTLATSKKNPLIPIHNPIKNDSLINNLQKLNLSFATLTIDSLNNSSGQFANSFIGKYNFNNLQIINKFDEDNASLVKIAITNPESYIIGGNSQFFNQKQIEILSTSPNETINYQAFAVTGEEMAISREFIKFLKTAPAKEIFLSSGFEIK